MNTDEYWVKVEQASRELSEDDKRELWRVLNAPVFIKAVRGIYEQVEAARLKLVEADLRSPEGIASAQMLQAKIQASFAVIDTLLTQAALPEEKSE